jgi:hypothetical protein
MDALFWFGAVTAHPFDCTGIWRSAHRDHVLGAVQWSLARCVLAQEPPGEHHCAAEYYLPVRLLIAFRSAMPRHAGWHFSTCHQPGRRGISPALQPAISS